MDRVGEAFVWPFRDPDWPGRVLVMGLILLIPIVGAIDGLGWMLAAIDRLRAGQERLPPANFDHLGRGFRLFVVYLAYAVAVAVLAAVVYAPAIVLLVAAGQPSGNGVEAASGVALSLLAFSLATLASLAFTFASPAIILATDRGGIAAGLRIADVFRTLRISPTNTLIAGLMLIAAGVAGQLGSILCVVGVVFTMAYSLAMQAWVVRGFEAALNERAGT
jgi:Protein of unknown function (DUF4013)